MWLVSTKGFQSYAYEGVLECNPNVKHVVFSLCDMGYYSLKFSRKSLSQHNEKHQMGKGATSSNIRFQGQETREEVQAVSFCLKDRESLL